jgi:hypothetical protein
MNSQEVVATAAQVAKLALKYAMARKHEQICRTRASR